MEITVTGRHVQVTDRFRRHLDDKLAKIPQLAPRVLRVDVVITHEPNPRQVDVSERVEITCHVRRSVVRAEASADEEYAALDLAMTRLLERLRRMQDRGRVHRGRHVPESLSQATAKLPHPSPLDDQTDGEASADAHADAVDQKLGTDGNSPIEVREKVHASAPMGLDQALNAMELVGHDFYLYQDIDTDRPSVVYRRRGWSYGVLHLDVDPDAAGTEAPPDSAGTAPAGEEKRAG